ncbi:MAG TPA: hypothetical protein VN253_18120, partial [Kofleriaceae bacterium]|nr:hypothetical protein [Kofleriaceae bacterium]
MSTWKTTIPLAAMAVLLAYSGAAAQSQPQPQSKPQHTYMRKQGAGPTVTLSERARPVAPKAAPAPERPVVDAETALSLEGLRTAVREEQEALLVDLIKHTPDRATDEKANLYFMLGELYAKQYRFYRLKGQELAIAADASHDPKQAAEAAALAEKARAKLARAVVTYKALADNPAFRNFPKLDQALFYYGYTLKTGGYPDEARAIYDVLIKDHPRSRYVPDAHLVFADYFFERDELPNAESRYRMVLKFPQAPAYWYATYRLGWIELGRRRFLDALDAFYRVAQATRRDPKQELLFRAAKKDFVRAYAEIGKAELAYDAFARVDAASGLDMLQLLADRYVEQGKSDKAIYVLRELMKRAPAHAHVCLWQYGVAQAMLSLPGASTADRVKEIEDLVRLHVALRGGKTLPPADAEECRDDAAAMSGEHARALHAELAKTQNPETLAHAERLYRTYLDAFPSAPDHPQTQYFYAELLWSRALAEKQPRLATELWERASAAFTVVVKAGKVPPAMRKEAAYAAVLGWKNALDIDPRPREQAGPLDDKVYDTVPQPRPIPEREQKMIAAFDLYLTYVQDPDDEELIRIRFLKANIYRRYDHLDEALPLFADILAKHRKHEAAEVAAQLLLDTYNRLHRYDEMLALAKRLSDDAPFLADKPELAAVIARLQHQALVKRADALAEAAKASKDLAKHVACGRAYLSIYNGDPERADNDTVLYNALVCFHEGKSVGLAIVAYNLLQKYYPKSPLMPRAVARIGKAYGDVAFYDKAAEALEQYARRYGGEADAAQVMSEVVFFNKGTGDDTRAIANTKYFVDAFGAKLPAEAATAMFSLASVYEKRGDTDGLVRQLRAYLDRYGAAGGADRRVIAYAKIGQALWAASCPVRLVDGSCVKVVRERAISRRATQLRTQQTQCGDATKSKLTVIPRDGRKVQGAMAAFAAAAA